MLIHDTEQNERLRHIGRSLGIVSDDIEQVKTFIAKFTDISKPGNWEQMSMSTAQGAAAIDNAYYESCFDGRYIYYSPVNSDTFLRFDTTQLFQTAAAWEKISMSTAQGGALVDGAYIGNCFDGRYIYYCTHSSETFLRFDTTQAFTTVGAWEGINASTALNSSSATQKYRRNYFDGRYVYYVPFNSDTFLRFDTTQSFTNSSVWEKINMSTALGTGTIDVAYYGCTFDGRYIYYVPQNSDTFLRFDTTLNFTNSSAWENISMSTAQGGSALDSAYADNCFDGRYVYYVPANSDTFLRFDTTQSFTNSSAWQQMSMSTAQGGSALDSAYVGSSFDGRYVYYVVLNSDTFLKFDTTQSFTNSSAWQQMSMSTAQGAAVLDIAYIGSCFDGRYVYYVPIFSDTFLRVRACPSNEWYK